MAISAADIKRQILQESSEVEMRKKIMKPPEGITEEEFIEIGKQFENLVKTKGWTHLEAFMIRRMNLVGLAFSNKDPDQKGIARGYIELMQYVDLMIKRKNEYMEGLAKKENENG
jgi:hypothetical protein